MKKIRKLKAGEKKMRIAQGAQSSCNESCWGHEYWVSEIEYNTLGQPSWYTGYVQGVSCRSHLCSFMHNELEEIKPGKKELI